MAAVVNVLRQNADQRAIVFGTTRDGVADLHRELVRQGFRAVPVGRSGAGERNRALSALREGEAQVLVATNVAARGLDLPEVNLVVHAIFPSTPRRSPIAAAAPAGPAAEGTSVLIANFAERRKAERLLAGAAAGPPTPGPWHWRRRDRHERAKNTCGGSTAEENREASCMFSPWPSGSESTSRKSALIHLLLERELANVSKGEKLNPWI